MRCDSGVAADRACAAIQGGAPGRRAHEHDSRGCRGPSALECLPPAIAGLGLDRGPQRACRYPRGFGYGWLLFLSQADGANGGKEMAFNIGFVIFPDVTQLDFTGPLQVLSGLPQSTIHIVAKSITRYE